MSSKTSEAQEAYFKALEAEFIRCRDLVSQARAEGLDPSLKVEIPAAADLADRVEVLMGVEGLAAAHTRVRKKDVPGRGIAAGGGGYRHGIVGQFDKKIDAIQCAIRTAAAIITEGVVAAPLEGISQVSICKERRRH